LLPVFRDAVGYEPAEHTAHIDGGAQKNDPVHLAGQDKIKKAEYYFGQTEYHKKENVELHNAIYYCLESPAQHGGRHNAIAFLEHLCFCYAGGLLFVCYATT
jgi:hypothetical protein